MYPNSGFRYLLCAQKDEQMVALHVGIGVVYHMIIICLVLKCSLLNGSAPAAELALIGLHRFGKNVVGIPACLANFVLERACPGTSLQNSSSTPSKSFVRPDN